VATFIGAPVDPDPGDIQLNDPHRKPPSRDVNDSITMVITIEAVRVVGKANERGVGYSLITQ